MAFRIPMTSILPELTPFLSQEDFGIHRGNVVLATSWLPVAILIGYVPQRDGIDEFLIGGSTESRGQVEGMLVGYADE